MALPESVKPCNINENYLLAALSHPFPELVLAYFSFILQTSKQPSFKGLLFLDFHHIKERDEGELISEKTITF